MDSAISRLLKVLSLERKQGFRNKAVIGGLDKFVSRWEPDARAEVSNGAVIGEIVSLLLGYAVVEDVTARERILDLVVKRAREVSGEPPATPGPGEEGTPGAEEPRIERPRERPELNLPHVTRPAPAEGKTPVEVRPAAPGISTPGNPPGSPTPGIPQPGSPAPAEPRLAAGIPEVRPGGPRPPELRPGAAPPVHQRPQEVSSEPTRTEPLRQEPPRAEPKRAEAFAAPEPPGAALQGEDPAMRQAERPESPVQRPVPAGLDAPVSRLPNVGPAYTQKLAKLGVFTVRDLLYLIPHRYEDYSQLRTIDRLKLGEEVTVIGTVWDINDRILGDNRRLVTARVGDGTGEMQMTWFNPYVERQLRVGQAYAFAGKVESFRSALVMRHPAFEPLDRSLVSTGRLAPVYPLTEGISVQWLRRVISSALDAWGGSVPDFLPTGIRLRYNLVSLTDAITQIHFPDSQTLLAAAHRRLSFDEFLILQLGVLSARQRFRGEPGRPLAAGVEVLAPFIEQMPFQLTGAQQRALNEIAADLAGTQPMSRLLQGDVGSGKTAVAAASLWAAVANGAQGAIMAPTEILAEQHFRSFGRMFENVMHPVAGRPVKVVMLSGSQPAAEREQAVAELAAGEADIAIGTHALIQGGVNFKALVLAVVDEQHRFGVEQRAALRQKGERPHILVMSATPIPRSLALTIYGDLDISVIDEMPAGRTPVRTKWLAPDQRERAYDFVRRQVAEGRQAFVIYPLVEESQATDAPAAVEEHARLQRKVFPELRVALLHGRMRGDEKDGIMRRFGQGEIDVLVATSVVEVGIDVPNAAVIIIEGAERFGLAQLHQFRGRVGRGAYPSYCILISNAAEGDSVTRLEALERTNDGFALAQVDLDLRGPGDFFGTRQSGLPPLRTAQLSDVRTLEEAREAAKAIFELDPILNRPEHRPLASQVAEFWRSAADVS